MRNRRSLFDWSTFIHIKKKKKKLALCERSKDTRREYDSWK